MSEFTKTETLRRLRKVAGAARHATMLPPNAKAEVGLRTMPLNMRLGQLMKPGATWYLDGDDLAYFADLADAARDYDVQRHGAVVHLYLSTNLGRGWGWELQDVVTAWLGQPGAEPVLLDVNGTRANAFSE